MCTLVTLLKTRGDRVGSKSPALRTLQSWIPSLFFWAFFLWLISTAKCEALLRNHFPLFIPFTPFYEQQIMQASFVLSLKVDLIAAPNYEIYQFYQSLIKIKNASFRFIFCLSGLLGCTSNVF